MNRDELNALHAKAPDHANEADHFYICKTCGQAVDKRRLGDVFYHETPDHEAVPVS